MQEQNHDCTISKAMVDFWSRAKTDWEEEARRHDLMKNYKRRDTCLSLARKAGLQMSFLQDELGKTGSDAPTRVGTHGSHMKAGSRVLITRKGNRVHL